MDDGDSDSPASPSLVRNRSVGGRDRGGNYIGRELGVVAAVSTSVREFKTQPEP